MSLRTRRIGIAALLVAGFAVPITTAIMVFTGNVISPAAGTGMLIKTIIGGVVSVSFASNLARRWNQDRDNSQLEELNKALNKAMTRNR